MTRKILPGVILTLLFLQPALASADDVLIISTSNGCPTGVPSDGSCGGNTCRNSGASVKWRTTGNPVESIYIKSNSAGTLDNCRQQGNGPFDYHCIAHGNKGDRIDYNIKLQDCEEFDPTIIIK
ncbi:MAG: hypothetical protein KDI19_15675 [Pseudomonadales bacterium]|nr:hypothetical protein [Pseudomonadales bacterium]